MLYYKAREIDARVAAIERAAEEGKRLPTVVAVGSGLGSVTIDGSGALVSVDLDRNGAVTQTGASLASHLLRAINQAEATAAARRAAMTSAAAGKEVR